uniref:Uncharacterized protein n=1 Tax=Noccaea caerulescens TaxID=107243 RepID=A0A1J3HKD1_NOCCA
MEKINTKAKLLLALFLMALLLSGAQGGRDVPEKPSSEVPGNNQQLFLWFGFPHFGWPFFKGWPGPLKAGLNKQNPVPGSQTSGDAIVAASTMFP